MEVIQLQIIVRGVVQGVGFRYSTLQKARQLGILGNVKNLSDGSVEINAVGSLDKIEQLIKWCKQGPAYAKVTEVITRHIKNQLKTKTFYIC